MTGLYDVSDAGAHWLAVVNLSLADPSTARAVIHDGQVLNSVGHDVQAGAPVAFTGALPNEQWVEFLDLAVNNAGSWAVLGRTSHDDGSRWIVIRDGVLVMAAGSVLDGVELGQSANGLTMNDSGDLAIVSTNTEDQTSVLVINDRVALESYDLVDIDGINGGNDGYFLYTMSGGREVVLSARDSEGIVTIWFRGEMLHLTTEQAVLDSVFKVRVNPMAPTPCAADLDGDGSLTVFDMLQFQNYFDAGDLRADFDDDEQLSVFDYLAFQNAFDAGCF